MRLLSQGIDAIGLGMDEDDDVGEDYIGRHHSVHG